NILKTLTTAIIGIIVVILLGGLFIDGTYSVQREITINKPVGMVYNYILYLKNQDNFSVWAGMDPEMKKEYKGTDGTVGFISGWESSNPDVGKGEQEIVAIDPGNRIDYEPDLEEDRLLSEIPKRVKCYSEVHRH
ncbi:MAG: SRPBCC family protein, partial [Candidatus Marinimicrobia bacterium]|nr:SRPBCC family protein [Candidatus Neomarinimicrobiota bacterium]